MLTSLSEQVDEDFVDSPKDEELGLTREKKTRVLDDDDEVQVVDVKKGSYSMNTTQEHVLDLLVKQILVEQCIQMVGEERRKRILYPKKTINTKKQYSLEEQVSVFPEIDTTHLPLTRTHVVCANCKREIGHSSYAPHLERCLNMRGSRRAAASSATNSISSSRSRSVVDYSEDALFGEEEEEEYKFSDEEEDTYESTSLDQKPKKQVTKSAPKKRKKRGVHDSEDDEDYEDVEDEEEDFSDDSSEPEPEYESDEKPKKKRTRAPKKAPKSPPTQKPNFDDSDDDLDLINLMTSSSSEEEEDSQSVSSSENLLQYIDSQSSSSGSPPKD